MYWLLLQEVAREILTMELVEVGQEAIYTQLVINLLKDRLM